MISPFPFLSRALASSPPPSFAWGEDLEPASAPIDDVPDASIAHFARLHPMAAVAYVLASAEWIAWYLRPHANPENAADYAAWLMASWVWVADRARAVPPRAFLNAALQAARDDAVGRPSHEDRADHPTVFDVAIEAAFESFEGAVQSVPDDESAVEAAYVTLLCEHVLPSSAGFGAWKDDVFRRLHARWPSGTSSEEAVIVARDLFDLERDAADLDNDASCARLLLEYRAVPNRFLPSPGPKRPSRRARKRAQGNEGPR